MNKIFHFDLGKLGYLQVDYHLYARYWTSKGAPVFEGRYADFRTEYPDAWAELQPLLVK